MIIASIASYRRDLTLQLSIIAPFLILPSLCRQACSLLLTPIITVFPLNGSKRVSSINPEAPAFTPSPTRSSSLETIGDITATRSLSSSDKASEVIGYHSSLDPEVPVFKPLKQRLTSPVAANKSALSTESITQESASPVSALLYTTHPTSFQRVRTPSPDEQIMAGSSHAGLSSSRWAVSPITKPKDEKTNPVSNLVVSNDLQVQTNVHGRITNMTTRRPDTVESSALEISTHDLLSKSLRENIPPNANIVSKNVEDYKVQGHTSETAQDPRSQAHTVRAESANLQPAQVQSTQAPATQTHFRPVQETKLFHKCS